MVQRLAIALLCVAACADEYRDAALKRAEDSVKAATEKASKDPSRPVYHFRPPANWMNDPNGTIFHNGYYHLFYQHNPYGDAWGHMHWGHARSKDLVHWEHLPIALWPSEDKGEAHVFSGCAAINGDGVPMLFYTSVASGDKKRPNEQWAAIGDPDLIKWEKHPKNPILDVKSIPFEIGPDWRDPFIFKAEGRTFLVCGADTKDEAIIPIFEAETPQLDKWIYRGILYRQPKSAVGFFECPNFFQLDGKWVLIFSPYKPLKYFIGSFDINTNAFTPEKEGTLDYGSFYASNVFQPQTGEPTVLVGWIRGFKEGLGWNGCMSIPRQLSIGSDGYLCQMPIDTFDTAKLKSAQFLSRAKYVIGSISVHEFALNMPPDAFMFVELVTRTKGVVPVRYAINGDGVEVDGTNAKWSEKAVQRNVSLKCSIDNTVLELTCCTYTDDASKPSGSINFSKVIEFSPEGYDVGIAGGNGVTFKSVVLKSSASR